MREDGKLPEGIKKTLARIFPSFAGKKISLSIAEAKERRSLDQNAYYRGVVLPHVRSMMYEAGDARSIDEWHETLLQAFSPLAEIKDLNGDRFLHPKRTHLMNADEMAKFITAITAECAERGSPVPAREMYQ